MSWPTSTYRLQLHADFTCADAAAIVPYLADLGVSHLYLSPITTATPGSTHGYDVVDYSAINPEIGGADGFAELSETCTQYGLSIVLDVVPNHMCVPTETYRNPVLWSVLQLGMRSPYRFWFDADLTQQLELPVLGQPLRDELAAGTIRIHPHPELGQPVLTYGEHVFPLAPGTEHLDVVTALDQQAYRLVWWRMGNEKLSYRRFFDVNTLIGVRVEDSEVHSMVHTILGPLVSAGAVTGVRVDHPDGLADPSRYLTELATQTAGAWTVVEKILHPQERMDTTWACAGTTGYDALLHVSSLFADPAAASPLTRTWQQVTGSSMDAAHTAVETKRLVLDQLLYPELARLTDLAHTIVTNNGLGDLPHRYLQAALRELLVAMPQYRAYVDPRARDDTAATATLTQAAAQAATQLPERYRPALDAITSLALGRSVGRPLLDPQHRNQRDEFVIRFQQTCGPVMAKSVEDTMLYRYNRWVAANEVGGDPDQLATTPEDFHEFCRYLQQYWPASMTTLSTHDTKRSEDVRARLYALTEYHDLWAEAVHTWTGLSQGYRSQLLDPAMTYLMWQTLAGTWGLVTQGQGIRVDRLQAYLLKAAREAKTGTNWLDPDPAYESALADFVTAVLADSQLMASVDELSRRVSPATRVAVLGQKLVQLTMPGVSDVYQGCEVVNDSLVDPDNRRLVDYAPTQATLAKLDVGNAPSDLAAEKLLVTSRTLRLRRNRPNAFSGPNASYQPVLTTTEHAVALQRGDATGPVAISVVTRLPRALATAGGWREHAVALPAGKWRNVLTGRDFLGGHPAALDDVLATLPVALLTRR